MATPSSSKAIVRKSYNPKLRLLGVVLSCVNRRTRLATELVRWVGERFEAAGQYGDFKTRISRSIAVAQAQNLGKTILQTEPAHKVTEEYRQLAREVMQRVYSTTEAVTSATAKEGATNSEAVAHG